MKKKVFPNREFSEIRKQTVEAVVGLTSTKIAEGKVEKFVYILAATEVVI